MIREALARLLPDETLPSAAAIGGYWTRGNDIEVDIVGADREPIAQRILFVGSIKWLEKASFDDHDLAALYLHRAVLITEAVPTVAISRNGVSGKGIHTAYGPHDLLQAWARRETDLLRVDLAQVEWFTVDPVTQWVAARPEDFVTLQTSRESRVEIARITR